LLKIIFSASSLFLLISIGVVAGIFLTIGREATDVFLSIGEIINTGNPFESIPYSTFFRHIEEMSRWYFWIVIVFWASLIIFVAYFVINIWQSFALAKLGELEDILNDE